MEETAVEGAETAVEEAAVSEIFGGERSSGMSRRTRVVFSKQVLIPWVLLA